MIFIAQKTKDGDKVAIKEIAQGIDSPVHFIAKILQDLSRKGLLQSSKGPNGGFYLDHISMKRSLADIVRAVDGERLFKGCGLGLPQCSESHPCPIHHQFKTVRMQLMQTFEKAKVDELGDALDNSGTFLKR